MLVVVVVVVVLVVVKPSGSGAVLTVLLYNFCYVVTGGIRDMDRKVYGRLVWLVTCLTILSFFSVLLTDLNFYMEKMKQTPGWQREGVSTSDQGRTCDM